eukprot:m.339836 g.339836  ORF g.339836 m.339836 type:complete len:279 (+) comp18992_c0_seq1:109-945(+)
MLRAIFLRKGLSTLTHVGLPCVSTTVSPLKVNYIHSSTAYSSFQEIITRLEEEEKLGVHCYTKTGDSALRQAAQTVDSEETVPTLENVVYRFAKLGKPTQSITANVILDSCLKTGSTVVAYDMIVNKHKYRLFPTRRVYHSVMSKLKDEKKNEEIIQVFQSFVMTRGEAPTSETIDYVLDAMCAIGSLEHLASATDIVTSLSLVADTEGTNEPCVTKEQCENVFDALCAFDGDENKSKCVELMIEILKKLDVASDELKTRISLLPDDIKQSIQAQLKN